ncbi:Uncharacterised protein [Mycobacteroides abscessus subsp. abscessus]|nr:Uncharacterised protein [Mycobacteroides abscessus subsp. abscessus]
MAQRRLEVLATVGLAGDLLGHLPQLVDDLGGGELLVGVAQHQVIDPLTERLLPDQVVAGGRCRLLDEHVTQRLERQV